VFYGPRGRPYQGAAYLVLGPVTGSFDLSLADAIFVGATANDQAGFSVSSAGDMDGDGLPDVLVGAPNAATSEGAFCCAGAAYVMSGTRRGSHGLGTAGGPMDTWYFGTSVDGLGDVDGDGLDDVLITANDDLDGDDDVSYAGASYVLFGPVSGRLDPSDADAKLVGEADYDYAGIGNSGNATAAAGDVDADGLRDIVIGTYSESDTGAAYVVHGGVTGTLSLADADAKLVGEAEGDNAGVSVSGAGDVDADGHDDILVGAYLNDEGGAAAGAAYLVRGPVAGSLDLGRADLKLVGAEEDQAGAAVSSAGDIDGDGRADVLVGAPGHSVDGVNGGAAYVLYGSGL
jgi:hypothetical protein